MSTELVACEFEDSQNCFWDAELQGNGIGESFVDIEGETFYIKETLEPQDGLYVDCGTQKLHYWYIGEDGQEIVDEGAPASTSELYNYDCTDETGSNMWLEPVAELPEPVEEVIIEVPVIVDPVPEELANTGTGDLVIALVLGLALAVTGVVLFIKGRKNK